MAQNDIKYIKRKLKESNTNIDTSDGSGLVDLFVNPFSSLLAPFREKLAESLAQLNVNNVDGLTDTQVENRAADFFVTRTTGAKASGYVRIYFRSPIAFSVPKGTIFATASGKRFLTTGAAHILANQMMANIERYPLYGSGDIAIEAETAGVDNEAAAGEINNVFGLSTNPVLITNPKPIMGGVARDSNATVITSLKDSATSLTITSPDSIKKFLLTSYPQIESITTVGVGDDEMLRDLYYSGSGWQNLNTSDFFGKISGFSEPPYTRSIAYYGYFADDSTTSGFELDLPELGAFTEEYPTTKYVQMYKNDANRALIESSNILDTVNDLSSWTMSDSQSDFETTILTDEIKFDTTKNMTKLGKTGTEVHYRLDETDRTRLVELVHKALAVRPRARSI